MYIKKYFELEKHFQTRKLDVESLWWSLRLFLGLTIKLDD
jgi:hypothetical protein